MSEKAVTEAMERQFKMPSILNDLNVIAEEKIALWKDGDLSTQDLAAYLTAMAGIEETIIR